MAVDKWMYSIEKEYSPPRTKPSGSYLLFYHIFLIQDATRWHTFTTRLCCKIVSNNKWASECIQIFKIHKDAALLVVHIMSHFQNLRSYYCCCCCWVGEDWSLSQIWPTFQIQHLKSKSWSIQSLVFFPPQPWLVSSWHCADNTSVILRLKAEIKDLINYYFSSLHFKLFTSAFQITEPAFIILISCWSWSYWPKNNLN